MEDKNSLKAGKVHSSGVNVLSPQPPERRVRRELKFRAFDTAKGKWIDGGYGFHILGEAMLLGGLFCDYSILELNNIRITQFTGLRDRRGQDIYEGDIVQRYPDHKYNGFIVQWSQDEGWGLPASDPPTDTMLDFEVISNVYGTLSAPAQEMETQKVG